jgi:hypothetical protein
MGSIIGRRPEELEAINMNLRNIMQRLEDLELRLSDELGRRVASEGRDPSHHAARLSY